MSSNMQRLGDTLANRMKKTSAAAVTTTLELGRIAGNMSLTTDTLRASIPKGEYMVNLMLVGSFRTGTDTGKEEVDDHSHQLPENFRGLQAGDRVLVAWCGNEPVVIAIVVSS